MATTTMTMLDMEIVETAKEIRELELHNRLIVAIHHQASNPLVHKWYSVFPWYFQILIRQCIP
jgi:hypothetical protein